MTIMRGMACTSNFRAVLPLVAQDGDRIVLEHVDHELRLLFVDS